MRGMTRLRDRGWLVVFAVLLFGALALRLWNLGTQSLWHDEAWSVFSGYHPLAWGELGTDVNAPPIFYMTLGLWQNLAGDSVWAMRCWSALLGTITVAVAIHIARRWFTNRIAAISAVFVAVSPMLWVFSQEIRAYVMMPLMALILLLPLDYFLRSQPIIQRRLWLWILVLEAVTLYIHNLSVPIIAWLNATVMLALLWQQNWRRLATWIVSQIGVAIVYLPWLLTQKPTGTPLNTPPKLDPVLIWNIWQSYFTGIKAMVSADGLLMALTAIFGLIGVLAIFVVLVRNRSRRTLLLLSQVIFLPIFELGIILAAHIDFHPRYFVVGIPATLLLIAVGLDQLTRYQTVTRLTLVGASALAIAIMVRMAGVMYSSSIYQHDDFRSIAERYAKLGPDDAIIIPYGWEPTFDYYSRKMNFKAKFINVPLYSNTETIISRLQADLQGVHRAELLTWYQLPADVRGAYPCLLNALGQQVDTLTVSGIKTDTYSAFTGLPNVPNTAPATWHDVGFDPPNSVKKNFFGPIELTNQNALWGAKSVCLITQWQLSAPTSENLQLSARLLNPLYAAIDWEISKADTQLLNDQQLPTSLWNAGQMANGFTLIPLPEGIVTTYGYPVRLTVYSKQMPQGFNVATQVNSEANLVLQGNSLVIGEVRTKPAPFDQIKPANTDVALYDGFYLHHKDVPSSSQLSQGQEIHVTLEWWETVPSGEQLTVQVALKGADWSTFSEGYTFSQSKLLTWFGLVVPANATGKATLAVVGLDGKSIPLGEYQVVEYPRQFTEPTLTLAQRVNAHFVSVGTLVGVAVNAQPIENSKPLPITLLWKADTTTVERNYTVFIHLLDSNNQVVGQSDAEPVNGTRPTRSWVAGEYLTDQHKLTFSRTDYHGPAKLEVGLYEPLGGNRLDVDKIADVVSPIPPPDHVILSIPLTVK